MQFVNIGQDPFATGMQDQGAWFPWYDSMYLNSSTALVTPGSRWNTNFAQGVFGYVRAGAGLVTGQLVALDAPATDTIISASSTTQVLTLNNGGLTVGAEVGNMVYIHDTSTSGFPLSRKILANTASTLTVSLTTSITANNQADANVLPAVPANNTPVVITRPNRVRVCTATLCPVGVALGTVTSGNYTIIQLAGYTHIITGTGQDTVAGEPAVPGAAGVVVGGTSTAFAYTPGVSIIALSVVSGGPYGAPYLVNFIGA